MDNGACTIDKCAVLQPNVEASHPTHYGARDNKFIDALLNPPHFYVWQGAISTEENSKRFGQLVFAERASAVDSILGIAEDDLARCRARLELNIGCKLSKNSR